MRLHLCRAAIACAFLLASPVAAQQAASTARSAPPAEGTYDLSSVEVMPAITNRTAIARLLTAGYPPSLRGSGVTGEVSLRFRVLENGRVDPATVTVTQSSHEAFNQPAIDAARRIVFRPAETNGRPVRVWVDLPLTFAAPAAPASPAGSAAPPPAP